MKRKLNTNQADPILMETLNTIKDVPAPEPTTQRRMQANFIHQVREIQPHNVTFSQNPRLNHQEKRSKNLFNQWRTSTMTVKIVAIIMALTTLFTGAGAGTVFAAQSALPDQALYSVKLWSEDVRLDLSQDPAQDLALHLEFADRRVDEMVTLAEEGKTPDNALKIELQTHLWMAAQLADQSEDPIQAQTQLRNSLMNQEMKLTNAPEDALMTQTRTMLRQQIHLMDCETEECEQQVCEDGGCMIGDQLMTQDQIRDQLRTDQPEGAGNPDANGYTGDYPEPQQGKDEDSGNGTQQGGNQNGTENSGNGNGQQARTPAAGESQQNEGGNGNGK